MVQDIETVYWLETSKSKFKKKTIGFNILTFMDFAV